MRAAALALVACFGLAVARPLAAQDTPFEAQVEREKRVIKEQKDAVKALVQRFPTPA